MIDRPQPESVTSSAQTLPQVEEDVLYLIGRGMVEHKETLYACHKTGFTAEVAGPIMGSVLRNIRPYLARPDVPEAGLRLLPCEPTPEMIRAALEASIRVRDRWGAEQVQPDSPGLLPSEMVRVVWRAMVHALPASAAAQCGRVESGGEEDAGVPLSYSEAKLAARRLEFAFPAGYEDGEERVSIGGWILVKAGGLMRMLHEWKKALFPPAMRKSDGRKNGRALVKT